MNLIEAKTNFFIYSPPKCGTTSVFLALAKHPQTNPCSVKEPHFFSYNYDVSSVETYNNLYPDTDGLKYESSTSYLKNENCIVNIKNHIKHSIKFIIILRNPIERFFSAYVHFRAIRNISSNDELHDAFRKSINWVGLWDLNLIKWNGIPELKDNDNIIFETIIKDGLYVDHIKSLHKHIDDTDSILCINYNDLYHDYDNTITTILNFLGINAIKLPKLKSNLRSDWAKYVDLDSEIDNNYIESLKSFYKPYNDQLEQFLDIKLNWN